ncbi:MAG: PHP domain-containing protein [Bacteroidota bacterium]
MTNKEIAQSFQLLGQLMHLHNENKFKIRSYESAYRKLRSWEEPLAAMPDEQIAAIQGVGKAIHGKIRELLDNGKMNTLERYKSQTPTGIQEMLQIKGFGPKKIQTIWKDLGVESVGELLYAVNENRLVELKGFGAKTQEDLRQKLEYYQQSRNQYHYAKLEQPALELLKELQVLFPTAKIEWTSELRRKMPVLTHIEILIGSEEDVKSILIKKFKVESIEDTCVNILYSEQNIPTKLYLCDKAKYGLLQLKVTGNSEFVNSLNLDSIEDKHLNEETQIFSKLELPFVFPELREYANTPQLGLPQLIQDSDLKGVLHIHTTASDGAHTLRDMCTYAQSLGYEYIGITDHSKSAFYASGLKVNELEEQWNAIDELNQELAPFKIFKGIESDILTDGSLDYEEAVLKQFDFIIASVHSNLKMDEEKATKRLINAIENPYTTILGHPTGRLLLSRKGYPIQHKKVIDACAANNVHIELNANPYRLDLDWIWIPYALEKGVNIAINPDAHSKQGIHDMHFGVVAARKGGLTKETCLNALSLEDFEKVIDKSRDK